MILLSSNAYSIFWLGRYLERLRYLCACAPFQEDVDAQTFAQAFALPVTNAEGLNQLLFDPQQAISFSQQFQQVQGNIQQLRGILSGNTYAELNQLIQTARANPAYICDVAGDCTAVLEAESQDIFLFFVLGKQMEWFDRQLRLQQPIQQCLSDIQHQVEMLKGLGWQAIENSWSSLSRQPSLSAFYAFNAQLQELFEVHA